MLYYNPAGSSPPAMQVMIPSEPWRAGAGGPHRVGRRGAFLALAAVVTLAGCGEPETATSWPQFRGPGGLGVSSEPGLPVEWLPDGNALRWEAQIPYEGVSSPIVAGSRVFLTGEELEGGQTDLKVMSLDLKTGDMQWASTVVSRKRESFPHRSVVNNPAGPTPATDGDLVFADFGTHLAALDFEGQLVWSEEIHPEYLEELYYGAGSSLVLAGDNVIVLRDRERLDEGIEGWIRAFDKQTGEARWKTAWDDTCCSFTTPLVIERGGASQIIAVLAGRLVAFDALTGNELWRRPLTAAQPVSSPALDGDVLCVATGAHNRKQTSCWRLGEADGMPGENPLWQEKQAPSTGSPVMYKGLLFTLHEKGFLRCQDPQTGNVVWKIRLRTPQYHASLVAGDDKIYAVSRRGIVSVLAAAGKLDLLAESELPGSDIVASPAIADGCLIVRTGSSLLCVEGSSSDESD